MMLVYTLGQVLLLLLLLRLPAVEFGSMEGHLPWLSPVDTWSHAPARQQSRPLSYSHQRWWWAAIRSRRYSWLKRVKLMLLLLLLWLANDCGMPLLWLLLLLPIQFQFQFHLSTVAFSETLPAVVNYSLVQCSSINWILDPRCVCCVAFVGLRDFSRRMLNTE